MCENVTNERSLFVAKVLIELNVLCITFKFKVIRNLEKSTAYRATVLSSSALYCTAHAFFVQFESVFSSKIKMEVLPFLRK